MLVKCDFIFYWGHGTGETEKVLGILGSREQELIPLYSLISVMQNKAAYFDACRVGTHLKEQELRNCTIACPVNAVDYDTSVKVGCTIMLGLFGSGMTFATAFNQALELTSKQAEYALFSNGAEFQVDVPMDVKLSLVECFSSILQAWLQKR